MLQTKDSSQYAVLIYNQHIHVLQISHRFTSYKPSCRQLWCMPIWSSSRVSSRSGNSGGKTWTVIGRPRRTRQRIRSLSRGTAPGLAVCLLHSLSIRWKIYNILLNKMWLWNISKVIIKSKILIKKQNNFKGKVKDILFDTLYFVIF